MRDPIRPTPSSLLGEQAFARRGPGLVLAAHRMETPEVYGALRARSEERQTASGRPAPARSRQSEAGAHAGQVPKISNVKLFATPADGAKTLATLAKGDEMIFMGEEQNGFLKVESGSGSGWVKKVLVSK